MFPQNWKIYILMLFRQQLALYIWAVFTIGQGKISTSLKLSNRVSTGK